ncbi:MAG: hypothetical protein WEC33_03160, partial [Dehalococcoidia bacterium]
MADLSIYLFWTGMGTAIFAATLYFAYVASSTVSLRWFAAQTEAGTVALASQSGGRPNPGLGRLATAFTGFTVLALAGAIAARWAAVEHTPLSNMYEFTVVFGWGIAAAYLAFETATRQRRIGVVALPIVVAMLFIASLFPTRIVPLIPALQNGPLLTIHVSCMMAS